MPRFNHYLGRILKHGLHVPDRKLRLFDRRKGAWGGRNPHDRVEMQKGATCQRLKERIEHLSYRDFAHHRRTVDSFSRIAAEALAAEGRRANPLDLLVRPAAVFIKSLLLKLGFLDISKAHCFAEINREVYIDLPHEDFAEGMDGRSYFNLYGTRAAVANFEHKYTVLGKRSP